MSHTSLQRTYHSMRRQSNHRDYVPSYRLGELFDDDELALKLRIAQHRILKAFDYATCRDSNGRERGTDNVIFHVGPRQNDLVKHVFNTVVQGRKNGIVTVSELPKLNNETASLLRKVAKDAEQRLLAVRLSTMVHNGDVWFNKQVPGTWTVSVDMMDDYRLNRTYAAEAKKIDARLRREKLHGGGRLRVVH